MNAIAHKENVEVTYFCPSCRVEFGAPGICSRCKLAYKECGWCEQCVGYYRIEIGELCPTHKTPLIRHEMKNDGTINKQQHLSKQRELTDWSTVLFSATIAGITVGIPLALWHLRVQSLIIRVFAWIIATSALITIPSMGYGIGQKAKWGTTIIVLGWFLGVAFITSLLTGIIYGLIRNLIYKLV